MMLTMSSVDRAGQVLAGRYRLVRPLAAGGSGRTYVAHDTRLERRVAVKVLHDGLAHDRTFLEQFRGEARAVASLSHPNIVTLHDWGEAPVPFMVFELLTGGSLAAILAGGTRLTPAQAVRLGNQVVAALEHAHARGLVHRDIKPGNLLFDDHGDVRVADFGLAKALAASGTTEPLTAGGIVGTARYAAPEQASGEHLGPAADLYSLGLVLVEAVTGQVPLVGETPLATLSARGRHPVTAPVELGPLGVVVERAGLPYPRERYPDAATMGQALSSAATMVDPPEPIPVAGLGVDLDEPDPTEVRAAVSTVAVVDEPTAVGEGAGEADGEGDAAGGPLGRWRSWRRSGGTSTERRLVPWVVATAASTALLLGALAWNQAGQPTIHAPNLVGHQEEAASSVLGEAGLQFQVVRRVHAPDPAGTVISQEPEPGDGLRRGSDIEVVISKGAPPVDLPAVVGQEEAGAVAALAEFGFDVRVEHRHDETVPAGRVILQEPSTSQAPEGAPVSLVVSQGPAPRVIPNVVGKTSDEARSILGDAGFEVTAAEEYSDSVEKGMVIRHDPVAGAEAVPGTTITIIVSKGPDRVVIPDVRGMTVEEATGEIEDVGLKVDVVGYRPGALVKKTDPEPGLMLERGRTVTLFM